MPTPAVTAIASAPQNVTRNAPVATFAPPARAAKPPKAKALKTKPPKTKPPKAKARKAKARKIKAGKKSRPKK